MSEQPQGFLPEETHFRLVFDTPKMAGCEVVVRDGSVDDYDALSRLGALNRERTAASPLDTSVTESVDLLLRRLVSLIVEWNVLRRVLDDDGRPTGEVEPAPVTLESLRAQSMTNFTIPVVNAWLDAVAGVAPPLPSPSESGASIPMDVLSL